MSSRQLEPDDRLPPQASRAPSVLRRHYASTPSASALLLTVLGEFVLPSGGTVWTSTLIEALDRFGVGEKATRQALTRTAGEGWIRPTRLGRRTKWSLSVSGNQLLTDGAARIYGFGGPERHWDRRWLLVLARVPETDRRARHVLRSRLGWAGLGTPSPGVWIGLRTDRVAEVESILRQVGIFSDAHIFLAHHGGSNKLTSMIEQAWDLPYIDKAYRDFNMEFAEESNGDAFVRLARLVHAWRRFPWVDPGLPIELLPPDWSGLTAVALFTSRHREWSRDATDEWARLDSG